MRECSKYLGEPYNEYIFHIFLLFLRNHLLFTFLLYLRLYCTENDIYLLETLGYLAFLLHLFVIYYFML
jgi:hypothetical protein